MTDLRAESESPPSLSWGATLGWAALHAVLFLLAMSPLEIWPAALVAVAPLVWLASRSSTTGRTLLVVFLTQWAMWLWLGRWLIPVTLMGYPAYAAYMSVYAVLFVWIIRRCLGRGWGTGRSWTLLVAVIWVGLEVLRGSVVFSGFPWYLLGHPLIGWRVLAQSADLWGGYGVSFLAVLPSGLLIDAVRYRRRDLSVAAWQRVAMGVACLQVVNVAYGVWRVGQRDVLSPGPRILAIQTNLPQDNKIGWTAEAQVRDFESFLELTRQAFGVQDEPPDLVVWPETMLPGFGLEPEVIAFMVGNGYYPQDHYSSRIVALRDELGVPLIVGSPVYLGLRVRDQRYEWDASYNAVYLIQGDAPFPRYDKYLLTPFGETMPYVNAWPWLEQQLMALGAQGMSFSLDHSESIRRLELDLKDGPFRIATPVCFEDTIARVCRAMVWDDGDKVVDLFVNLSNDGWFSFDGNGRRQHMQTARFRCIENRVGMIRVVNTGLSVAIDSTGNVIERVGEGRYGEHRRAGWMSARIPTDRRFTLYGRIGDAGGWACLAASLSILVATLIPGIKRRKSPA